MRAFYSNNIQTFIQQSNNEILGIIAKNNAFDLNDLQKKHMDCRNPPFKINT